MSGWKTFSMSVAAFDCFTVVTWLYVIYCDDLAMLPARAAATPADAGTIVIVTAFLVVNAIMAVRLFRLEEER